MQAFLILAPYGVFAGLMLVASSAVSLFVSAAACLAVMAYDRWYARSTKILAAGSVLTFTAAGLYVTAIDPALGGSAVRLAVDAGIFLVSVLSILFRYPFTLQYALEVVDAETAKRPAFIRANYVITWAWAAAMALMMIGNAATMYVPWLPFWGGLLIAFAARNCAIFFTNWYAQYLRAKYAPPPAGAQ
ncbi:MAG: hypothetical protein ACRC1G_02895 [Bradyrhizobium sp.]|nr:hypothetical protein [Bradyrhizobium sp.]